MKMQQIICFCEIAKTQSFTTAAGNLYLSQPSVSYNIRELEKELGVPLLDRSFTGVKAELTEYGKEFLKYADEILRLTRECETTFNDIHRFERNRITVGCTDRLIYSIMPELTKYAAYDLPSGDSVILDIKTSYTLADIEEEIRNGAIDLGLYPQKPSEDFDYKIVNADELVAFIPDTHRAAKKNCVKLAELRDLPLALPYSGKTQINECIERMFEEEGLEPETSEYGGKIVQDRFLGVMLGKCYTISSDFPIDIKRIAVVRIDNPFNKRDLYAIWKKGRELSENEQHLIAFCENYSR